jgi:hypothetical protein
MSPALLPSCLSALAMPLNDPKFQEQNDFSYGLNGWR